MGRRVEKNRRLFVLRLRLEPPLSVGVPGPAKRSLGRLAFLKRRRGRWAAIFRVPVRRISLVAGGSSTNCPHFHHDRDKKSVALVTVRSDGGQVLVSLRVVLRI